MIWWLCNFMNDIAWIQKAGSMLVMPHFTEWALSSRWQSVKTSMKIRSGRQDGCPNTQFCAYIRKETQGLATGLTHNMRQYKGPQDHPTLRRYERWYVPLLFVQRDMGCKMRLTGISCRSTRALRENWTLSPGEFSKRASIGSWYISSRAPQMGISCRSTRALRENWTLSPGESSKCASIGSLIKASGSPASTAVLPRRNIKKGISRKLRGWYKAVQ